MSNQFTVVFKVESTRYNFWRCDIPSNSEISCFDPFDKLLKFISIFKINIVCQGWFIWCESRLDHRSMLISQRLNSNLIMMMVWIHPRFRLNFIFPPIRASIKRFLIKKVCRFFCLFSFILIEFGFCKYYTFKTVCSYLVHKLVFLWHNSWGAFLHFGLNLSPHLLLTLLAEWYRVWLGVFFQ